MRLSTLWRPLALPLLLLASALPAQAQAILTEGFTGTTFPPPGWTTFETGIGTVAWTRVATAPTYAQSNFEGPGTGTATDIDWLVTPSVAVPASPTTTALQFKMWQGFGTVYNSVYRILISTTSQTDPTAFTQVAQWNETTACPGGTGAPPTAAPAARNCTLYLAAYAGQSVFIAFQHENNDGDVFRLDDVLVQGTVPGPGVFATTLAGVNFGPASTCVLQGAGFTSTFAISNTGGGGSNVTVQSITFSGPQASSFALNPPQTFPIVLGPGASVSPRIFFSAPAGASGPQNATVTVTYTVDGGAAQTVSAPLSGSADAEGAGIVFRGTAGTAACANGVAAPPAAAFIDITGHTQITALNADDVVAPLALSALPAGNTFGTSVRLFGVDYTSIQISSNGTVALGAAPALSSTFYGGITSPVGLATLQVAANDNNLSTATYEPADPGQFPVGVYYGLANVDGVGGDELVITYFHAYDFGSVAYTATANAARYYTAQLVVFKATRANEEDRFEFRYPDGNDATGTAFRVNTGIATTGIEAAAVIGVGEPTGTEAAIYRIQSFGGPMYSAAAPNGAVGIRFQAEAQSVAMGQAGWRMMGTPVRNYTVGRLAGVNLVQSVTGQYPTFPADNLYTDYDGTSTGSGYVPAANVTDVLVPGQGFIWYLFNQNITPNPANDGGGTSRSYTLPMLLEGTGAEPALTGGFYSIPLVTTGNGFNLIANPFRDDLDVSTLGSLAAGGTLVSAVPQVWDPNTGSGGSYVTVSGSVSTWQGFFVQNNTATALNIPTNLRNTTGTFLGLTGAPYSNAVTANPARLAFELTGTDAATGGTTVDLAATLVFADDATDGFDLLDASKLAPLANAYATVAFQGELDGEANLKAQESRALDAASFDVPLVVDAVGTDPTLTLSWGDLSVLPSTWAIELRDLVTGETVDLRSTTSYTFEQAATAARGLAPEALVAQTTVAAQMRATDAARFVLHVTTARTTGTEAGAPAVFALAAPAPNPTASSATIAFDVPEASAVNVSVYDLLGRRVAVLAQGQIAAGRHTARLDAGTLAPGVYVVRMEAGTFSATQRVTVVR